MGVFDNILSGMRINDNDDYYDEDEEFDDDDLDYDDDELDEDEEEVEKTPIFKSFGGKSRRESSESPSKISSIKQAPAVKKSVSRSSNMQLCVVKPTSFADSKEIVETLLEGKPVVLNMEGIDLGLAQRIIDVTSGACLAIDGALQKVTSYIFIITPPSVEISGDLAGLMDSIDFSGLQTGF